ncbi:hypothetical protein HK405_000844, partial [Cladochytrium tenue]
MGKGCSLPSLSSCAPGAATDTLLATIDAALYAVAGAYSGPAAVAMVWARRRRMPQVQQPTAASAAPPLLAPIELAFGLAAASCWFYVGGTAAELAATSSVVSSTLSSVCTILLFSAIAAYLQAVLQPASVFQMNMYRLQRYAYAIVVAPCVQASLAIYAATLSDQLRLDDGSSDDAAASEALQVVTAAEGVVLFLGAVAVLAYLAVARHQFVRSLRGVAGLGGGGSSGASVGAGPLWHLRHRRSTTTAAAAVPMTPLQAIDEPAHGEGTGVGTATSSSAGNSQGAGDAGAPTAADAGDNDLARWADLYRAGRRVLSWMLFVFSVAVVLALVPIAAVFAGDSAGVVLVDDVSGYAIDFWIVCALAAA